MQTNLQIYDMFTETNSECAKTGETVMQMVNETDVCELIAGALDAAQIKAICDSLQQMENSVSDPNKKCEQVIALLKAGYYSWTGEQL